MLSLCASSQLLNKLTCFHETVYEYYAIEDLKTLQFLTSCN
jgi:hypothetical protein